MVLDRRKGRIEEKEENRDNMEIHVKEEKKLGKEREKNCRKKTELLHKGKKKIRKR